MHNEMGIGEGIDMERFVAPRFVAQAYGRGAR